MLRDIPAVGWLITALIVLRTVLMSLSVVGLGSLVDDRSTAALWIVIGLCVASGIVLAVEVVLPQRLRARQEAQWRAELAQKNFALTPDGDTGEAADDAHVITQATEATEKASTYTVLFLGPFFAVFIAPIAVIIVLGISVSWPIAGVLSLGLALIPPVMVWARRGLKSAGAGYGRASGQLAGAFLESVRTLGTTLLLGASTSRRAVLKTMAERMRVQVMILLYRNQLMILVTDGAFGLATTTVAVLTATGGYAQGTLSLGQAFAVILLARLLIDPINRMGRTFYTGMAGRASLTIVKNALSSSTRATPEDSGQTFTGDLVLRDLSISRRNTTIISGLSLTIPRGAHVAIIGPSGSGKSTLALALAGLIDVNGTITIGGHLSSPADRRASVSLVPQSPTLFSGTLTSNIDLAHTGIETSHLIDALLGSELPATMRIGETGRRVSGGQAARISMARGLAKGADIMILDEATAQLDHANSRKVRDTAQSLGCTLIEITHRPAEALEADTVVVLEDGHITGYGSSIKVAADNAFFRAALQEEK
ncbi:ABC transporter ATPase and permease [Corynebacterium deserti GIMN1.010]|uniref:ABC transporter ATPase and permease n=2 Tax=Corynebacterium TaxID=1716 RepID=A0A0M4CMI3_9CORY|nr:ABC transporter ATPase and permease [Corynebacterium deserti GIMN1.010]